MQRVIARTDSTFENALKLPGLDIITPEFEVSFSSFVNTADIRIPSRAYLDELHLAGDIVNVGVFLRALKKPGSRRKGTLWREQA